MVARFAAMESRINAVALASFANATATIGGVEIDGIFRNGYGEAMGFIGGSNPQITCASADVAGVAEGATVTIGGTGYTVAETHPDGTGITVLKLETA